MGLRGPPPTPTNILKARGSWRAEKREADGEVQFEQGRPTCPAWLSKEAKAEWSRQVTQLEAAGILTLADRAVLAAYCEAWGEFATIARAIDERVDLATKNGGAGVIWATLIAEGLVNAKNRAAERLLRLAGQFGFSPAARARVKGGAKPDGEEEGQGKGRYFA